VNAYDAWDFWKNGPEGKNGIRETLLAHQEKSDDADSKKSCMEGSWAPEGVWKMPAAASCEHRCHC